MARVLDGVHHHWRDPMQLVFVLIGAVTRSAVLFMRCAGVAFVCLGMCTSRSLMCARVISKPWRLSLRSLTRGSLHANTHVHMLQR